MQGAGTVDHFTLAATPRIHIVPPEPRTLDERRPEVEYLATLVGFCRGQLAELDALWLVTDDDSSARCLEHLRPLSGHAGERADAWLRIGDLAPHADTFGRWRKFCTTNQNSASMIAQYLRDPPRHMTIDRLLVLVRFFEEYAITSIAAGTVPKSKDKLHKVIRFLMEQHAGALGNGMGKHHGQAFPKAVADTRNYHTHFNPDLAALAATELSLVILIDRLWLLTRAVVLSELGYDDDQIAAKLGNDPRTSWLAAQS
jgi:ApeA N-terminal domain 1